MYRPPRPRRPFTRTFGSLGLTAFTGLPCTAPSVNWEPRRVVAAASGGDEALLHADGTLGTDPMAALAATLTPPPGTTEGPVLVFSHSMDGGVTFHAPVPILYGEQLGRTSVAADGDLVVVAFEDPDGTMPRIGLALSRTMGHIFEQQILPVSDDHESATRPLAAVRGRRVAVAWRSGTRIFSASTFSVRTGTVR